MGGHGGLNILPQKRWNVYNYDNRERVRKDEEAAAKEEQIKREQSRKRDTEFRLEKLRQARGLPPAPSASQSSQSISKSDHINLFEGLKDFPSLGEDVEKEDSQKAKKMRNKKLKKEEEPRVVLPEDEKYRLGYGLAGKGVKAPWYLSKPSFDGNGESGGGLGEFDVGKQEGEIKKKSGKKSLQELREERLKREELEKERERALLSGKKSKQVDGSVSRFSGFSRR